MHDGKVDLNLIQPACMHWTMHRNQVRVFPAKPWNACRCAMSRSIVHNPENSTGFVVGSSTHHLIDEPIEWLNPAPPFTAAEQFGSMHIQSRQIRPGTTTPVLVFDLHRRSRLRWKRAVPAATCLNAGFFVCRQNELVVLEVLAVPNPLVQVENTSRFFSKVRISREDPTTMLPWSNGILVQPPPYRRAADRCYASRLQDRGGEISPAPSRKRHAIGRGQLARKRLDLNDQVWGKKPGGGPGADAPPDRRGVFHRISCAIARPPLVGFRAGGRFRRYQCLLLPAGSFWPAVPENTPTYIVELGPSVPAFHQRTRLSGMDCVSASLASSFTNPGCHHDKLESIRIR